MKKWRKECNNLVKLTNNNSSFILKRNWSNFYCKIYPMSSTILYIWYVLWIHKSTLKRISYWEIFLYNLLWKILLKIYGHWHTWNIMKRKCHSLKKKPKSHMTKRTSIRKSKEKSLFLDICILRIHQ